MIIKFDHISYVAAKSEIGNILKDKGEPKFKEIGLKNIDVKYPLMKNPQPDHDLYFYDCDIPTEYIFYNQVCSNTTNPDQGGGATLYMIVFMVLTRTS